jgi:NADH:ubiquinone oxidoreductase subunit 5 (subunit L)/multisubunit Na+/H+ antiporter MnhA subunit
MFLFLKNNFLVFEGPELFKFDVNVFVAITFYLDNISINFSFLTLIIGLSANLFSYNYMKNELIPERFIFLLNLFIISMYILICSESLIMIILGWELIGVTSYLLINFYTNKVSVFKSAFKAFIFNKFSDFNLILSILTYFYIFKSFNLILFNDNFFLYKYVYFCKNYINVFEVFSFLLVLSSFCKSAQFGFHT